MKFERTPETIALNAQLEIVRLDDLDFATPNGSASVRGWGFYIPGRGYIAFNHDNDFVPYSPIGGRDALQSIIDTGGFIDYNGIVFLNPMTHGERVFGQFAEMKHKHPDALLLFRIGDFYETFADDAVEVSKILNITLTRRKNGNGFVFIAGFPHHALDSYLPKIVRAGKRVAICEQLESPREKAKRTGIIVKRGIDAQTESK
ncbi:MAG: hypothetical protein NC401_12145 [Ruminococcus sp.]|nr:hypothetical protein [Ruminococcus sp.]